MTFFIRATMVMAVIAVAIVAGWLSYQHAYHVVLEHGETGMQAKLYPMSIDGLVYCASMALLNAAHNGRKRPRLASWLLAVGICVTATANVWYGVRYGLSGALVAFWPAAALVGSYELLMTIWRSAARDSQETPDAEMSIVPALDKIRPGWNVNHYRAATHLLKNPDLKGKEFGKMINVSERHANRILKEVREAS